MTARLDSITEDFLVSYLRGELSDAEQHEIEAAAAQDSRVAEVLDRCRASEEECRSSSGAD